MLSRAAQVERITPDGHRRLLAGLPVPAGGKPAPWLKVPALNPTGLYGLGANGLKIHKDAVWVSNSDQGTLLRIPIEPGGAHGPVATKSTGPHLDDFTFVGDGDTIVAALDPDDEVALIRPDGTYRTVLTGRDGLEGHPPPPW